MLASYQTVSNHLYARARLHMCIWLDDLLSVTALCSSPTKVLFSAQGCGWAVPGEWRKITDTWTESV